MAAFWALVPAAALACTYLRPIILTAPPAAVEGYAVVKLRIANGLVVRGEVIALEGIVVEQSADFREGSLVRFIVPDRWMEGGSCYTPPYGDLLDEKGEAVGYVQLRALVSSEFYTSAFPASGNEARLKWLPDNVRWQPIRFGKVD